jgi:hypothetical protein
MRRLHCKMSFHALPPFASIIQPNGHVIADDTCSTKLSYGTPIGPDGLRTRDLITIELRPVRTHANADTYRKGVPSREGL